MMKGLLLGASLSVVFAAGLLIGNSGIFALRAAHAAKQWEYQCDWARSSSTLSRELNELSGNSWELVNVTHSGNAPYYCVKR